MEINEFIQNYGILESKACKSKSNLEVSAFTPVAFQNNGFRTDIESKDQLYKYIDTMHVGRFSQNLFLLGEGLTTPEFELFKESVKISIEFTKSLGKELIPINALTRAFISYRAIKSLSANFNELTRICEIGPGSGYLGLLCGLSGFPYSSVDVTKNLTTYQNALWNFANIKVKFAGVQGDYSGNHFLQIPWWEWSNLKTILPERNIVVMNHVIKEMTPLSLRFSIRRFTDLGAKFVTAEGLGYSTNPKNTFSIIDNCSVIHNGTINRNYQKIWLWKINKRENKKVDVLGSHSDDTFSLIHKAKIYILTFLESTRLFRKLGYGSIKFKQKVLYRYQMKQKLSSMMVQPKIVVSKNELVDFLISCNSNLISDDDLFMTYSMTSQHL
jgi:hypothetical protein